MSHIGASFVGYSTYNILLIQYICVVIRFELFFFIYKLFISYSCRVGPVAEYKLLKQKKKQKTFKKISLCHSK